MNPVNTGMKSEEAILTAFLRVRPPITNSGTASVVVDSPLARLRVTVTP